MGSLETTKTSGRYARSSSVCSSHGDCAIAVSTVEGVAPGLALSLVERHASRAMKFTAGDH